MIRLSFLIVAAYLTLFSGCSDGLFQPHQVKLSPQAHARVHREMAYLDASTGWATDGQPESGCQMSCLHCGGHGELYLPWESRLQSNEGMLPTTELFGLKLASTAFSNGTDHETAITFRPIVVVIDDDVSLDGLVRIWKSLGPTLRTGCQGDVVIVARSFERSALDVLIGYATQDLSYREQEEPPWRSLFPLIPQQDPNAVLQFATWSNSRPIRLADLENDSTSLEDALGRVLLIIANDRKVDAIKHPYLEFDPPLNQLSWAFEKERDEARAELQQIEKLISAESPSQRSSQAKPQNPEQSSKDLQQSAQVPRLSGFKVKRPSDVTDWFDFTPDDYAEYLYSFDKPNAFSQFREKNSDAERQRKEQFDKQVEINEGKIKEYKERWEKERLRRALEAEELAAALQKAESERRSTALASLPKAKSRAELTEERYQKHLMASGLELQLFGELPRKERCPVCDGRSRISMPLSRIDVLHRLLELEVYLGRTPSLSSKEMKEIELKLKSKCTPIGRGERRWVDYNVVTEFGNRSPTDVEFQSTLAACTDPNRDTTQQAQFALISRIANTVTNVLFHDYPEKPKRAERLPDVARLLTTAVEAASETSYRESYLALSLLQTRGSVYRELRMLKEAEADAEAAVELSHRLNSDPNRTTISTLNLLGQIRYEAHNYAGALEAYKKANEAVISVFGHNRNQYSMLVSAGMARSLISADRNSDAVPHVLECLLDFELYDAQRSLVGFAAANSLWPPFEKAEMEGFRIRLGKSLGKEIEQIPLPDHLAKAVKAGSLSRTFDASRPFQLFPSQQQLGEFRRGQLHDDRFNRSGPGYIGTTQWHIEQRSKSSYYDMLKGK